MHKKHPSTSRHPLLAAAVLLFLVALAACSGEPATPTAGTGPDAAEGVSMNMQRSTITAELFYRERIALPPGAVAVAALEVAGSDTVVVRTRDELADQSVPVSVTLDVDQSKLPQDAGLVFRGSIEVDGVPVRQSEPRPVDVTSGTIELGSVMLMAVEEPDTSGVSTPSVSALAGSWVVEDIRGGGIIDDSRVTLEFSEGRVAGSTSCNSYQGAWSLEGNKLSIEDIAVTMMACPEALMNQERRFLDALNAAEGMRVDDTGALFLTSGGNDLLRARQEP